jgi:Tfp pilus assembly protein PilZ
MVVKRERTRHLIKIPAELSVGDKTIAGTTVRMSEKGFFVRTQTSFCVGTPVDVTLHLADNRSCVVRGIVKYARNIGIDKRQNGMGIELSEGDPQYREFIRSHEEGGYDG